VIEEITVEQPDPQAEPIRYVGGPPNTPRPPAWPYALIAGALVVILVGGVLLWQPIRSLGHNAGEAIAPYSLSLSGFRWSSDQEIANVPLSFSMTVGNLDQRTANGLTLRFVQLDPAWKVLDASSATSAVEITGNSIYFTQTIPPAASISVSVKLVPSKAMASVIGFTLTAGHGTTPARVQLADGSVASTLAVTAKVRAPTQADADARLTAIFDPEIPKGQVAIWQIHVANTGPIDIPGIRLRFPDTQSAFEFSVLPTQASLLPDGSVGFQTTLPPGGQSILVVGIVPHQSGHFQIPMLVFLGDATQPISAANGGPPLSIELTVD